MSHGFCRKSLVKIFPRENPEPSRRTGRGIYDAPQAGATVIWKNLCRWIERRRELGNIVTSEWRYRRYSSPVVIHITIEISNTYTGIPRAVLMVGLREIKRSSRCLQWITTIMCLGITLLNDNNAWPPMACQKYQVQWLRKFWWRLAAS
jgi:hypothetical protein